MATRKSASPPVEYASAMDKIRDEMAKSQDNYTQVVGEYLTGYRLNHPEAEEKIMAEGKSIAGSLKAMETEARKVKQGNVAVLDDRTAFGIVLRYFGIEATGEATSSDPPQAAAHLPLKGKASGDTGEKGTSSVTADAVPPSPEGKAFGETGEDDDADLFDLDALLGVM